jgi:uncharacterized protein YbjT (DUF2867 family)
MLTRRSDFAVRAARDPDALGDVVELGGPDAVSPHDVVRIFEEVGGAPFEVQHVSEDALQAQRRSATDSLSASFAALMLDYAHGDEIPMDETLRRVPVHLTSVRDYATRVLGA